MLISVYLDLGLKNLRILESCCLDIGYYCGAMDITGCVAKLSRKSRFDILVHSPYFFHSSEL